MTAMQETKEIVWDTASGDTIFTHFSSSSFMRFFKSPAPASRRASSMGNLGEEANEDISAGRLHRFNSIDDMIASLPG